MDKFLMICYVAADFVSPRGDIFRITPDKIGVFVEAPGWVQNTLLFKMLVKDGSIKVGEQRAEIKKLENDPMEGIGADGKEEKPEEKIVKTRKTPARKKKDDAE